MQYKKMGRTGLKVSRICLGTMTFGSQISETEAINVIKSALSSGVNFLDTADGYPPGAIGRSEEIIGKALKGERHSVVVATKVYSKTGPGPNDEGLSRKHIIKGIEDSLRRLQTDYIDLYYAHYPDYDTPIEETLHTMDDLVHQGKVRYIGCSNFSAWQLCKALWMSDVHNLARFDCIEPPYNLLTRDIENELLPLCANEGVGVCGYNPLAGEMLTGRHEFGKPPAEGRFTDKLMGQGYLDRYWLDINFKAVDSLKVIAKEHGVSLPQFALAWILSNETITSALSGSISPEQLKENLAATEITLSQEELKACDDVWQMFRPYRYAYAKQQQTNGMHQYGKTRLDMALLASDETMVYYGLVLGADGALFASVNIAPELYVEMYELVQKGNLEMARRIHERLMPIVAALHKPLHRHGIQTKIAIQMLNMVTSTATRTPPYMADEDHRIVKKALAESKLI